MLNTEKVATGLPPDFMNRFYDLRALAMLVSAITHIAKEGRDELGGEGYSPYAVKVAKLVDSLPEWERNKYVRFLLRLRNNDAKAQRLGDMCARGQISRGQLLAAM